MFEKTKNFVKEHREVIYTITAGAVVVAAACAGYKYATRSVAKDIKSNKAMNIIYDVLSDIPDGVQVKVYGGIHATGLAPKDLGKLGESMITSGADEIGDAFTHFIAIKKIET